jgi:hypothetical protein
LSFSELIIFHYHLRKGGVTDVVILSIQAIAKFLPLIKKVKVLIGNSTNLEIVKDKLKSIDNKDLEIKFIIIPELDYLENISMPLNAMDLYSQLQKDYGGKSKLWWIHNYHLGKNPIFTKSLLIAAQKNQPLLLQIHDFPECARYENLEILKKYIVSDLYPQGKNVRYALINQRDVNLLSEGGIPSEELFLLDNPVPLQPITQVNSQSVKDELFRLWGKDFPAYDPQGALILYPVRSIRRKNVLEAGLLVKLLPQKANLIITLPGVSKSETDYSEMVDQAFMQGLIPGMSSIGIREENDLVNYQNLWAASDMIISSSIQEGFGYLYVNSLHWRKPLLARYLDIMGGVSKLFHRDESIFYNKIKIPLNIDQKKSLLNQYLKKLKDLEPYMYKGKANTLMLELSKKINSDNLCFSYYSMELQWQILKQIQEDPDYLKKCILANKELLENIQGLLNCKVKNRDNEIEKTFGEKKYALKLEHILESYDKNIKHNYSTDIQKSLIEAFTTLPYIRMLY